VAVHFEREFLRRPGFEAALAEPFLEPVAAEPLPSRDRFREQRGELLLGQVERFDRDVVGIGQRERAAEGGRREAHAVVARHLAQRQAI
jgi:hypothetical protein